MYTCNKLAANCTRLYKGLMHHKIYQFDCFHRHMLANTSYYQTKAHYDVIFFSEVCVTSYSTHSEAESHINSTTGRILASVRVKV